MNLDGAVIDSSVIGGTTAAAGSFTTLSASTSITGTLATAAQPNITCLGTLTGLNVAATATMDGLTVDGGAGNSLINFTPSGTFSTVVSFANAASAFDIVSYGSGSASADNFRIRDNSVSRLNIAGNGDISFYDDTGTSQALFWDASAESLGIGTTSPESKLAVKGSSGNADLFSISDTTVPTSGVEYGTAMIKTNSTEYALNITSYNANGKGLRIYNNGGQNAFLISQSGGDRFVVDGSGNVGIGETNPAAKLHIESAATNEAIRINAATGYNAGINYYINNTIKWTAQALGDGTDAYRFYNFVSGEAMRLDSSGEIHVNKTSTINNGQFEVLAQVNHQGVVSKVQTDAYSVFQGFNASGSAVFVATGSGNLTITGALSKGSGSFKIDHPLESKADTHHLVHSFVEAPQADNIYRGKVNLVDGSATVNIDTVAGMTEGTFVALNTDVQCFTSNESDWDAVKGSVSGNVLTISCQNTSSTATVSWLVIGERQDQHMIDTDWTDANGKVIVEPEKETQ